MVKYSFFIVVSFCFASGVLAQKPKQWPRYGESDTLSTNIYLLPFKLLKEDVPHLRAGFEMPLKALNPVYFAAGGEVGIIDPNLAPLGSQAKGYNMRAFVKCYLPNPHKLAVRAYLAPVFFRSEFSEVTEVYSPVSFTLESAKMNVVQNAVLFRLGLSFRSDNRLIFDSFIGTGAMTETDQIRILSTNEAFSESFIDFPVEMGFSIGFVFDK